MADESESILILSDLHFGKYFDPKFKNPEHLRDQLVQCLKNEKIKPSLILCPGDLTSLGTTEEFEAATTFLKELLGVYGLGKEALVALVGNHDVNRDVHKILKESTNENLARYLSAQVQACYHWPEFDIVGPIYGTGIIDRGSYAIIAFNSSWNCFEDDRKNGEIGPVQIEWINKISAMPIGKKPCIVTLHHHPDPIPYPTGIKSLIKDLSQVSDGQEFLHACSKLDVQLIVHGHRHHPALVNVLTKGTPQKKIPILCAGSLSVESKKRVSDVPNFFHVLQYTPGGSESALLTFNSTARGVWDSKYNPDFHETITPLQAIPGASYQDLSKIELEKEIEALCKQSKPINFQTVSSPMKCMSRAEAMELIGAFASKNGKRICGEYSNKDGLILIDKI